MARTYSHPLRGRSCACAWASLFLASTVGRSQVVVDGKFSPAATLPGPNYAITPELGSTHGNNLFHSFERFNLNAGDVATFSGPANIQNILSRVTGATPSSINGTIRSEIPGANFFLINPSGVIFGPNAAVDVSGAFAVSSANYLKLADGARFIAALDADDSALSTAPVSAFGFLNGNPGNIVAQQSIIQGAANQTISVVGGEIQLEGASITAPMGTINLVSVNSAGESPIDPSTLNRSQFQSTFPQQGKITMNSARVDANGEGGGRIVIRGGSLVADNSKIEANTLGSADGGGIDVALAGELALLNVSQINSLSPSGLGASGNIAISADTIRMLGGGQMDENFGPAAQISTATGDMFLGGGPANGGNISIRAGNIELVNSAQISAATFGVGNAGRIDIDANSLKLDAELNAPSQISANSQPIDGIGGLAGEIHIRTDTLDVANGAVILSAAFGTGGAGVVDVTAKSILLRNSGIITAGTFGEGNGGNVNITTDTLTIDGRDLLTGGPDMLTGIQAVTTSPTSPAPGGNIQISAKSVDMKNNASIFTSSLGAGKGGDIAINAGNVSLANASTIQAASSGEGVAGQITVQSSQGIVLTGLSSLNTSAPGSSGGDITVRAGSELRLVNSEINAQAGLNGGNIVIAAPNLIYLLDGKLTAQADTTASGFGNGGNLSIDPSLFLIMNEGSLISKSSLGNGGNIVILTDNFFRSASLIDASAPFGLAGTVSVTAPEIDLSGFLIGLPGNLLDAESQLRPDCAVRLADDLSSFVVLGRGGLPIQPGGFLPSGMTLELNEKK
jgi:filamentous hemagglutinin family protein